MGDMGIYFISAGRGSRNREKSLDKGFLVSELTAFLSPEDQQKLKQHFERSDQFYAWGANRLGDLNKLSPGTFVVDVKNKEVVRVFASHFG
jgi:hypothetical protein